MGTALATCARPTEPVMIHFLEKLEKCSKPMLFAAGLGVLILIGVIDYLTGFEIMFSIFYLLEVALSAWYLGRWLGLVMSILSAAVWVGGDVAAGARYSNPLVPVWNALILAVFYFIVVWLLTRLRSLHNELESRVQQRTQALTREMAERQRLEEEILLVSEREQRRIGHDLHDNLCQHLTATALAGQVLQERLAGKSLPETADAGRVVELVEDGIDLARNLARGLYPVEMDAEGLMSAFQELALNISRGAKVRCSFECEAPVLIHDDATATHLYRIAQEAVRNAVAHGKPKRIWINLSEDAGEVKLSVEDDGVGLPESPGDASGLGIRIMAHRAAMVGGSFSIEPAPTGGTIVVCSFPRAAKPDKP
ncbi:MAG TPA: sensor histidine kinase [Verrucomicrobiae bacterium]|nr:sensor histidine kinase [Verrucomicrobiae bacterium]